MSRRAACSTFSGAEALGRLAQALQVEPTWLAPLPRNPSLADHRDRRGLTQASLAELLGTSAPTVSHTERGLSCPTDIERWADAYGINRIAWIKAFTNGRTAFFGSRLPKLD